MATLIKKGSFGSADPNLYYELYAEQTGGSGTSRTVKVSIKVKVNGDTSASFYGYPADWRANINGTWTSYQELKGSEKWYGNNSLRTFSRTITTDVGTTASKGITVGFQVNNSTYTGWNGSTTGSFTVDETNVAPTWNSGALVVRENNSSGRVLSDASTANSSENAIKVAENISNIYLSWPTGKDDKTGFRYNLRAQKNDGAWYDIYNGTATNYTHAIGSGSATQGDMWDYYVRILDSDGVYSSVLDSRQFQKNVLTPHTLTASGSIGFSTSSIALGWSGASNTNGNTSFTTELISGTSGVPVYNGTSSTKSLTIYRTGTVPTTPYIRFDDLKTAYASGQYKGTFTLKLRTKNAYGSSKDTSVNISVNLQVAPTNPSGLALTKATIAGGQYIVPSVAQPTLTWNAITDQITGSTTTPTYAVYVAIGTGAYSLYRDNLTSRSLALSLPSVQEQTTLKVKVVGKTTYNTTSEAVISANIDYWAPPTIEFGEGVRTADKHTLEVFLSLNSSMNLSFSKRQWKGKSGTLNNFTGVAYTIVETGLKETDSYTITVNVADNTNFAGSDVSATYQVAKNVPIFSMREKGVGINTINTGANGAILETDGNVLVRGDLIRLKRSDKPADYDNVVASREVGIDLRNINEEGTRIFARQDGGMVNTGLFDIQGSRTYLRYTRENRTGSDSTVELRAHNFTFTADKVGSSTIKILEANYVDEYAHFVALGGGGFTHIFGGERQNYEGQIIAEGSSVTYGLSAEDLLLSANRYVYLKWNDNSGPNTENGIMGYGSSFQPTGKGVLNLGTSGYRFATIYAVNALNTSDSSYKENIVCINDKSSLFKGVPYSMEKTPTAKEVADFILDTPLYTFDYKNMEEGASQYGLMADEIKDSPVAQRFVYDLEEGSMISTQSYASALHITIQEQQKQIQQLIDIIEFQNDRIGALEQKMGIMAYRRR